MGIPSYFSYIVKNHSKIIKRLTELKSINNFYLDSNSIIYDCLRDINNKYDGNNVKFENLLIKSVIKKLDIYIKFINPSDKTIVAFDGVAPVAKLEQQRTRRYKSYLMEEIKKSIESKESYKKVWDKTAITPGTKFMHKLGKRITNYYSKNLNVIISTSSEPGEGEHKIFQYIRNHKEYHKNRVTLIYGLDADLIMLCLNHMPISKHIYLYRETPEFIKSINTDLEPNQPYFMDIPELSNAIIEKMTGHKNKNNINVIHDYIFLCLLLGNDFLPHFPSLNIRKSGIHILMAAYYNTLGKTKKNLSNGKKILWFHLKILVEYLAEMEHDKIKDEYKDRNKLESRFYPQTTIEEKLFKLENIPTQKRELEKFIDPFSYHWESRYYKKLFDLDINKAYRQCICINYLEGLEWVLHYYTTGCIDWRWMYKYNYPPLLKDLLEFIPSWDTRMIENNNNKPVSEITQLSYVLPKVSLKLLPKKVEKVLLEKFEDKYPLNCELEWAFCKYLWESHPKLPNINISELETLIS